MNPFDWLSDTLGVPVSGSGQIRIGTTETGAQLTVGEPRYKLAHVLLLVLILYLFSRGR